MLIALKMDIDMGYVEETHTVTAKLLLRFVMERNNDFGIIYSSVNIIYIFLN